MSEGVAGAPAAAGPPAGAAAWQQMPAGWCPRALVWRPWRWRAFADPVQWVLGLAVVCAGLAITAGLAVGIHLLIEAAQRGALFLLTGFAIGVAGFVVGVGLAAWLIRSLQGVMARRLAARLPKDIAGYGFVRACVLSRDEPREAWTARSRTAWMAALRAESDATAYLDPHAAQAAAAIARIPERLEPERVGGAGSVHEFRAMIGLTIFAVWWLWVGRGGWISMLVPGTLLGVGGYRMARLGWSGRLAAPLAVGPGWVKWGNLAWSVRDSVLVAQRASAGSVQASIVGPAGVVRIRLRTDPKADGQFATLWTRWMHDRPEPPGAGLDEE